MLNGKTIAAWAENRVSVAAKKLDLSAENL
jgi:hypothetical protein